MTSSRRTKASRGGNILPRRGKLALRFVSWNARGLLTVNIKRRKAKLAVLAPLLRRGYIILLQEVHGDLLRLRRALQACAVAYDILHNDSGDPSIGGTVFLVPRSDHLAVVDLS
eukprot:3629117-Pyramimonas_sp.AAC.1